jgi:hypothetical protein
MKRKQQMLACCILPLLIVGPLWVRADSIEQCKEAVRRNPDSIEAICNLADAYTEQYIETGKANEKLANIALKIALEARKLNRDSALPHAAMARVYQATGNNNKATERALWAAKLAPDNPQVKELRDRFDITDHDVEFFFAYDDYEGFTDPEKKKEFDWENVEALFEQYKIQVIVGGAVVVLLLLGGIYLFWRIIKLFFKILFFPFRLIFGFGKKGRKKGKAAPPPPAKGDVNDG